ncbi:MAG TPA: hypothetical protein VFG44_08405 [Burkholderiales bacterium]|nr:hypothetical protein [Burkholderiales bacterium]
MFSDVIREAKNEHEIYFLLTSYVEAVRFGDQLNLVPQSVKTLPLGGLSHVRQQLERIAELDKAPKDLNDNACMVIKEALQLFSTAVDRLESLGDANPQPLPERRRAERRQTDVFRRPHAAGAQGETRTEPNEDYGQPARL